MNDYIPPVIGFSFGILVTLITEWLTNSELVTTSLVVGLLVVIVGYLLYARWSLYSYLTSHDAEPHEARAGDPAGVTGEIIELEDDHVSSPLDDEQGAIVGWRIEEWNEHGDRGNWVTRGVGVMSSDYYVQTDENRTVLVSHPDEQSTRGKSFWAQFGAENLSLNSQNNLALENIVARLGQDNKQSTVVEASESPPEHIEKFLSSLDDINEGSGSITNIIDFGKEHGRRRYSTYTLDTGDTVFVHGQVASAEEYGQDKIVGANNGMNIISNIPREKYVGDMQDGIQLLAGLLAGSVISTIAIAALQFT